MKPIIEGAFFGIGFAFTYSIVDALIRVTATWGYAKVQRYRNKKAMDLQLAQALEAHMQGGIRASTQSKPQ